MADVVLFDMDGVIIDSEKHWDDEGFALLSVALPGITNAMLRETVGMSLPDTYDLLASKYGLDMAREEFLSVVESVAQTIYRERVSLLPGFLGFMESLRKQGFRTALVSSAPEGWIGIVMERFGISHLFDLVISADNLECRGKPDPAIYVQAARQLGEDPHACVVIEDSENGVASAKAAGMKCIGLRNGFNDGHDISGADLIVKGFGELSPDLVRKLAR